MDEVVNKTERTRMMNRRKQLRSNHTFGRNHQLYKDKFQNRGFEQIFSILYQAEPLLAACFAA